MQSLIIKDDRISPSSKYFTRCTQYIHNTPLFLPCYFPVTSLLLPCYSHVTSLSRSCCFPDIPILLPCYMCLLFACDFHVTTLLLPCYSLLLHCYFPDTSLSVSCYFPVASLLLSCCFPVTSLILPCYFPVTCRGQQWFAKVHKCRVGQAPAVKCTTVADTGGACIWRLQEAPSGIPRRARSLAAHPRQAHACQ